MNNNACSRRSCILFQFKENTVFAIKTKTLLDTRLNKQNAVFMGVQYMVA